MPIHQPPYQRIRDHKLAQIQSCYPREWRIPRSQRPAESVSIVLSIPETCGILTPREIEITSFLTAKSLLENIKRKRHTSLEVCTAYCKRASIAHQLVNCLTEPLFEAALKQAEWLDDYYQRTGELYGPLHGLPISVKDSCHFKGYDSSIGIASLCFRPASTNAAVVDLLLQAGAVIHCKTNVPQTLGALDSVNNIFGRSLNPLNRHAWTAGGSSGGEAALVAMRGSVMGIGTDVGGSVRIPAMCCDLVGFKPSTGRIPTGGQQSAQPSASEKIGLEMSLGVIARCTADIGMMLEAVERGKPWEKEADVIPGQWWSGTDAGMQVQGRKPIIGFLWTDGNTTPLPPVRRCMHDLSQLLHTHGVEIINIHAPRIKDLQSLTNKFFAAPGNAHIYSLLDATEEPLIPWLRNLGFPHRDAISLSAYRELWAKRYVLQDEMLKIWKTSDDRDVDAIICPVAPHPVPGIDEWGGVGYTSSFILLDWPAASIPIRRCVQADLEEEVEGKVLGRWDEMNRALCEYLLSIIGLPIRKRLSKTVDG